MLTTVAFANSPLSPAGLILETTLRFVLLLLFLYGLVSLVVGIVRIFKTAGLEKRTNAKKKIKLGLVLLFFSTILTILLTFYLMPTYMYKNIKLTANCVPAGCSGQLCLEESTAATIVTDCEWKEEYACYKDANCAQQPDGNCGWDQTPELLNCLDSPDNF